MGIRKVVLYKHGVGYFERQEEIEGNSELLLSFRQAEMNDVLKSLTVEDLDGGSIGSVSYDTQQSVDKLLEEAALDIPESGGAHALLGRLRGANVRVRVGARSTEGQIVGLEELKRHTDHGLIQSYRLTLLDSKGSLFNLDMSEVSELTFLDETVRKELAFYYDTLVQGFKPGAKTVRIFGRGEGTRRLSVSFVVESPVWKTSYRFILADPEDTSASPFLEGWALIDNPQDEDWKEVELSLVAGLPISFIHDLYTPRYVQRREVKVNTAAVAGPVAMAAAFPPPPSMDEIDFMAEMAAPCPAPSASFGGGGSPKMAKRSSDSYKERAASQVQTVTQSVGDLFEYKIANPVTVNRRQSALVPIVAKPFSGGRVVLYKRSERAENPFAAVEFHNTTGLTLEGGPVMVFEGDTYAGEAMLDTMKPDEKRIVPFAIDLSVNVDTVTQYRDESVHTVRATSSYLQTTSARVQSWTYRFNSNDTRAKVCWIEHPMEGGSSLYNSPEPTETTTGAYRFRIELKAKGLTEFTIHLRSEIYNSVYYNDLDRSIVLAYHQQGFFTPFQEASLEGVVALIEEMHLAQRHKEMLEKQLEDLETDQARVRENLGQLGSSSDEARLRTRYVEKLENQESRLEELQQEAIEAEERCSQAELSVEAATSKLNFVARLNDTV